MWLFLKVDDDDFDFDLGGKIARGRFLIFFSKEKEEEDEFAEAAAPRLPPATAADDDDADFLVEMMGNIDIECNYYLLCCRCRQSIE